MQYIAWMFDLKVILVVFIAVSTGCGAQHPPSNNNVPSIEFANVLNADDVLAASFEGDTTVIDIDSRRGIGSAEILLGETTPATKLVLRFRTSLLENVTLTAGDTILEVSVLSHSGRAILRSMQRGDQAQQQVLEASPYWTTVRMIDGSGNESTAIDLGDGYIEVAIPEVMLGRPTDVLAVTWIDAYR